MLISVSEGSSYSFPLIIERSDSGVQTQDTRRTRHGVCNEDSGGLFFHTSGASGCPSMQRLPYGRSYAQFMMSGASMLCSLANTN